LVDAYISKKEDLIEQYSMMSIEQRQSQLESLSTAADNPGKFLGFLQYSI